MLKVFYCDKLEARYLVNNQASEMLYNTIFKRNNQGTYFLIKLLPLRMYSELSVRQ